MRTYRKLSKMYKNARYENAKEDKNQLILINACLALSCFIAMICCWAAADILQLFMPWIGVALFAGAGSVFVALCAGSQPD